MASTTGNTARMRPCCMGERSLNFFEAMALALLGLTTWRPPRTAGGGCRQGGGGQFYRRFVETVQVELEADPRALVIFKYIPQLDVTERVNALESGDKVSDRIRIIGLPVNADAPILRTYGKQI